MTECKLPPLGWWCSREGGHEGPCAARHKSGPLHVGFTGTRNGLTNPQVAALTRLLAGISKTADADNCGVRLHHGDCVGADSHAHDIAMLLGYEVEVHPPLLGVERAYRLGTENPRKPLPYMKRNLAIVTVADLMVATPPTDEELEFGGTWRTVGLARKAGKPLYIITPDGYLRVERDPGMLFGD